MNPADFGSPPASACTQGSGAADRITRTVYDLADQRLQVREGVGTAIEAAEASWAYNLAGQITAVIDGNGNRAALRYDGHGRQDRWTFPAATRATAYNDATQATALASAGAVNAADYEEYGYDAAGNRVSHRKRDGSVLTYQYDNLNRMILKVVPERTGLAATHTRDVHYGYDLRNLQLYARFDGPGGEGVTNSYDGFGRPLTTMLTMDGVTPQVIRPYDLPNNLVYLTHPDGTAFTYAQDALGWPASLWLNGGTALAGLWYYPHGAPSGRSPANGAYSQWGYDAVQRVSWLQHNAAGAAADLFLYFGYNPASQIASRMQRNDAYA